MKRLFFILSLVSMFFCACNKTGLTSNPSAILITQTPFIPDTISFDTVFTGIKSITQSFMISNINKQNVRISDLRLFGGDKSDFNINVNGKPGTDFQNIDIAAGDSIYVFVTLNINPTNAQNAFLVSDSIGYSFNGNTNMVQLRAYGQNAVFLNSTTIRSDTSWTNHLPIVVLGNVNVAQNATLTIEKGTQVYCHAKTSFTINGTLKADGGIGFTDRIVFTNDRLDYPYNEMPGGWNGITLGATSNNNVLNNVTIKNATAAMVDTTNTANLPARLRLNGCILNNISNEALLLGNSSVVAANCLIANSGAQVSIENGGNYSFTYCTIVGYSNDYVSNLNPCVQISNRNGSGSSSALQASFINCIIYGDNNYLDEIAVSKTGEAAFQVNFTNDLYKANSSITNATFSNCIQNADPQFQQVDNFRMEYDFQLQAGSIAIENALPVSILNDLLGQTRDAQNPSIGCYEFIQ